MGLQSFPLGVSSTKTEVTCCQERKVYAKDGARSISNSYCERLKNTICSVVSMTFLAHSFIINTVVSSTHHRDHGCYSLRYQQ